MRLLDDIANSEWFYAPENRGGKIKSPVELWVGIRRIIPMELHDKEVQLALQRSLGQILFYPPNVVGWPGGRAWIDSSSLMFRMAISPLLLVSQSNFEMGAKDDDDVQMGERVFRKITQTSPRTPRQPVLDLFKDKKRQTCFLRLLLIFCRHRQRHQRPNHCRIR